MKNTTPYYNCPTFTLNQKSEKITEMIRKINDIPGDVLGYVDASELCAMLIELRRSLNNQIENREKGE